MQFHNVSFVRFMYNVADYLTKVMKESIMEEVIVSGNLDLPFSMGEEISRTGRIFKNGVVI